MRIQKVYGVCGPVHKRSLSDFGGVGNPGAYQMGGVNCHQLVMGTKPYQQQPGWIQNDEVVLGSTKQLAPQNHRVDYCPWLLFIYPPIFL